MRLSRVYIDADLKIGQLVKLPADKSHYLKNVLRLKNRQSIYLFNGHDDTDYLCAIEMDGKQVNAYPESGKKKNNDSSLYIHLILALGKSEHVDFAVQKATELGITKITLFNAERTQAPLKKNRLEKKMAHLKKIAISACEQCYRNQIPNINFSQTLTHALGSSPNRNLIVLDQEGSSLNELKDQLDAELGFELLLGCEGGLTIEEIAQSHSQGFLSCSLGPRVLRMETASSTIISLVQHTFGDMH